MRSRSLDTEASSTVQTREPIVLIVDDNEKNLKLATDVLRAAGLGTIEATNGADAIALAGKHVPDVILMDLRLPDMDGTDAVQTLKADARTAGIPVVALSSLPLDNSEWFVAAGFAGYLEKPINVGGFPNKVRSYCKASPQGASLRRGGC